MIVVDGIPPLSDKKWSPELRDFAASCLWISVEKRASAHELLQVRFLWGTINRLMDHLTASLAPFSEKGCGQEYHEESYPQSQTKQGRGTKSVWRREGPLVMILDYVCSYQSPKCISNQSQQLILYKITVVEQIEVVFPPAPCFPLLGHSLKACFWETAT